MKTCLVLEGGAKRGIYTAGVLDVLLEEGLMPDGVIGVSAGAIHGCSYVAGQRGRSIRYNLKYNDDYRFMSFRSWLQSGNMVDTDFAYHELPDKLDIFDHKAFESSKAKFYATCTNVETGKAEYIHCPHLRSENIDYIRASASMPFVSQIVQVGCQKYLDGGIADSIPLKEAQELGYDRVVVVQTRPEGYRKKPFSLLFMAKLIYRHYPKFVEVLKNRHLMYNRQLDEIAKQEKNGQILVIRPSRYVRIGKMERNPAVIQEMYDLGRSDAQQKIKELKKFWR